MMKQWDATFKRTKKYMVVLSLFLCIPTTGILADTSCSSQIPLSDISLQSFFSKVLYVGGDGPNNYTTIQEAVDAASTYDTIYVYHGIYFEHVSIDKSLHLIGEERHTTIIDGSNSGDVISIIAPETTIEEFTIQHSGDTSMIDAGIEIQADHTIIAWNILVDNGAYGLGIFVNHSSHTTIRGNSIYRSGLEGVFLLNARDNLIIDNEFSENGHCAVVTSSSSYNTIISNSIHDNYASISLWPGSTHNEITGNLIVNQSWSALGIWAGSNCNYIHHNMMIQNGLYGITILAANHTRIEYNTISGNTLGLTLSYCSQTMITHNNFINNSCHAYFDNSSNNRWIRNYWDDHHHRTPKRIEGERCLPWNPLKIIKRCAFDWFPVKRPYHFV